MADCDAQQSNSNALVDRYLRAITYLRLSVTDRCDLRCRYCMPERMRFEPRANVLSLEELHQVALGFIARGVRKIRLTGGEPLVRRDAIEIVRALGAQLGKGLDELTLTTNGIHLARFAQALRAAGVERVNISLDTLDREKFARITRRDALDKVIEGIEAARAAGLKIKLNTLALKGVNLDEIPQIIEWAHRAGDAVTLIETMPLGQIDEDRFDRFAPLDALRQKLEARWSFEPLALSTGGPARYFRLRETGGVLGMITPMSQNFCASCNRLRVTATGQLYPCLGGGERVDLRAAVRSSDPARALDEALDRAMAIKPERHHFEIATRAQAPALERHMSVTGG